MQGWRNSMEDVHIAEFNIDEEDVHFFGVFDGHGGFEVAKYVKDYYVSVLKGLASFKRGDYKQALTESFLKVDENLLSSEG